MQNKSLEKDIKTLAVKNYGYFYENKNEICIDFANDFSAQLFLDEIFMFDVLSKVKYIYTRNCTVKICEKD